MRNPYADALGVPVREGAPKSRPSPSHIRAKKQEREVAKRLGAKLVSRSGAGDEKGDVRLRRVARIECKTTGKKSFPLTLALVAKLEDAVTDAEVSVLVVEFNDAGKPLGSLAVIPLYLLEEFCEWKTACHRS